jgi:hypothetical protein
MHRLEQLFPSFLWLASPGCGHSCPVTWNQKWKQRLPSLEALRTQLALGKPPDTSLRSQWGKELPTWGEARAGESCLPLICVGLKRSVYSLGLHVLRSSRSSRAGTQGKRPDSNLPLAEDMNSAISSRLPSLVHTHREQQGPCFEGWPLRQ